MHPKEDDRPEQVKEDLDGEEEKPLFHRWILDPISDDKVQCDPHQDIEDCPCRTKQPVWRVEGGFCKRCIPSRDSGDGEYRTDQADNKRDGEAEDEKDARTQRFRVHSDQNRRMGADLMKVSIVAHLLLYVSIVIDRRVDSGGQPNDNRCK